MMPIAAEAIRASFVNATAEEVERLSLPDLAAQPWEQLDFLGWVDPGMPHMGAIVVAYEDGVVGLLVRIPPGGPGHPRRSMCNLCHCVQPGGAVRLMSIPRAGELGRRHNVLGSYLCADLACSLYVRGVRPLSTLHQINETLSIGYRTSRLRTRLNDLVHRVLTPPESAEGAYGQ